MVQTMPVEIIVLLVVLEVVLIAGAVTIELAARVASTEGREGETAQRRRRRANERCLERPTRSSEPLRDGLSG